MIVDGSWGRVLRWSANGIGDAGAGRKSLSELASSKPTWLPLFSWYAEQGDCADCSLQNAQAEKLAVHPVSSCCMW